MDGTGDLTGAKHGVAGQSQFIQSWRLGLCPKLSTPRLLWCLDRDASELTKPLTFRKVPLSWGGTCFVPCSW